MSARDRSARRRNVAKKRARRHRKRDGVRDAGRPADSAPPGPPVPNKFTVPYGTPAALALLGPLVRGTWSVPEALQRALLAAGRPVPAPVVGHMLVDTGASRTAIATHAAQSLGLHPIGVLKLRGAHGEQDSPLFYARFSLAIADPNGARLAIQMEQRVCGVPDLERAYEKVGAQAADGSPVRLIGLLGRDFLQYARMTYDGPQARVTIEVDTKAIKSGPPPASGTAVPSPGGPPSSAP